MESRYLFFIIIVALKPIQSEVTYCGQPLGLSRGSIDEIPDDKMTGTSYFKNHKFRQGRLSDEGWTPKSGMEDPFPYLEVELHSLYMICGFAVQGCAYRHPDFSTEPAWVTRYRVQVSPEKRFWDPWNFIKPEFYGGSNATQIVYSAGERKVGRYVRIFPVAYVGKPCMKVEIYGNPYISPGQSVFTLDKADKMTYKAGKTQKVEGPYAYVEGEEYYYSKNYAEIIPRLRPRPSEVRVNTCVIVPYKKSKDKFISGRVREVQGKSFLIEHLVEVNHRGRNSLRRPAHEFDINALSVMYNAWCGEIDFYARISNLQPVGSLCQGKVLRVDAHLVFQAKGDKSRSLIRLSYKEKDRNPNDYVSNKPIKLWDVRSGAPFMIENHYGCLVEKKSNGAILSDESHEKITGVLADGKIYKLDHVRIKKGKPPECKQHEKMKCDVSRISFTINTRGPCPWKQKWTRLGCQDQDECKTGMASCALHAICINTKDFYSCHCPKSFSSHDPRFYDCRHSDKCKGNPCPKDAFCTRSNSSAGFSCSCNKGFIGDGFTCKKDLCTEAKRKLCDKENKVCRNLKPRKGTSCECKVGFKSVGPKKICHDVDECAEGKTNCTKNAYCRNTHGSYNCECKSGYYGDGEECRDITECADPKILERCHSLARCIDTDGSYKCQCKEGYVGDGQVRCVLADECQLGIHNCHKRATCINTQESYECRCNKGYEGDGKTCKDIDECGRRLDTCPRTTGVLCVNKNGSFYCNCDKGFDGDGYKKCDDINECELEDKNQCVQHAVCINTVGSYTCRCKDGFKGDARKTCTASTACLKAFPDCDVPRATCDTKNRKNKEYTCQCKAGYAGDGKNCTDIDECRESVCSKHATCANIDGSFSCQCNSGYTGDGFNCSDLNECNRKDSCGENAKCFNAEGSYYCVCDIGYHGDPYSKCADLDECTKTSCSYGQNCTNTEGSYLCLCMHGYHEAGSGVCKDVNECSTELSPCGTYNLYKCENQPGTYACRCTLGYAFNHRAKECEDVNECNTDFQCDKNAECVNTDGSYHCVCSRGFYGDGENFCKESGSPSSVSEGTWNLLVAILSSTLFTR